MAVIAPLIGAAQVLQTLGLASAIINAKTMTKQQIDNVFWLTLTGSVILGSLVAAGGPILGHWLTGRDFGREYAFISLALFTSALALSPNAMLARALRFRAIALRNLAANAIGVAVTVALAAKLHNHWALLVAPVLVPLINFALAANLVRWRPGLPGEWAGLRTLLTFGLRVCATNLLTFVSRNADNLIVAGTSTAYQLGIYDRSYRVLSYPLTQAVVPLGQVLVPTLTRTREDEGNYRVQFWQAAGLLLIAATPGLALMMAFPETIIGLLLGPAWLGGARLFAWFAAAAIAEIILAELNWLLVSQGRGKHILRIGLVSSVAALTSFGIGAAWGILGIAVAFTLGRVLVSLPFAFWLTGRQGPIGWAVLTHGFAPHAFALAITLTALFGTRTFFGTPLWPSLIAISCAAYLLYFLIFWLLRSSVNPV